MADIELTDIVERLAKLQVNYSNLAKSWFDIFYNPEPMDVQVEFYDENNNSKTYVIPNRAKDRNNVLSGSGSPENVQIANIGAIYLDTLSGAMYIKTLSNGTSVGWVPMISETDMDSIIHKGEGTPVGQIIATSGQIYIDTSTGHMYMKRSSTGTDGWERIDSYPTSQIREVFTITEPTTELVLNGVCESVNVLSVYENGVLVPPAQYAMPFDDKKTLIFEQPITVPETEESVELLVQYFVDIHVASSEVEQSMIDLAADVRKFVYGDDVAYEKWEDIPEEDRHSAQWFYTEMMNKKLDLEEQINGINKATADGIEAIDEKYQECQAELDKTSAEITEFVNIKEDSFAETAITIINAANELSDTIPVVSAIREDCEQIRDQVQANADYVKSITTDVALKSDFEAFKEEVGAELDDMEEKNTATENAIYGTITTVRNNLQQQIIDEGNTRQQQINNLQDNVNNYEASTNSWMTAHTDLGAFTNEVGYVKESDFPIDVNGIYHYNMNKVPTQSINLEVGANCTYYTLDLGSYMDMEIIPGSPAGNTDFDFSITPDKKTVDTLLLSRLKEAGKAEDIDNIVSVFRCYFKNDSEFTPFINWDYRKISWLGEEPELEAGKSYMVEFISYDMMSTWVAHVLGICQPAVAVDTFTTQFTIESALLAQDDAEGDNQEYVTIAMIINGREVILDEEYLFNLSTGSLTVTVEVDRKYAGNSISAFYIRSANTPAFVRYSASALATNPIVLSENGLYTINCDTKITDENHSFALTVRSTQIENYMEQNNLETLDISAKFTFDWGYAADVPIEGQTYIFNKDYPGDNGVTYTFTVADGVLTDPLLGETEPNRITLTKVRYVSNNGTDEEGNPIGTEVCLMSEDTVDVITDGSNTINVAATGTWE